MFDKGKVDISNLKISNDFDLKVIPVSLFKTNCVVFLDKATRDAVIFDPGAEGEHILEEISKWGNFNLKYIIATHAHLDHIGHIGFFKEKFPKSKFLMHKGDIFFLTENPFARFAKRIKAYPCPMPDEFIDEGDIIEVGRLKFQVIHTPGHSPGSVCFYEPNKKLALTGDTIFKGSTGRTDLILGNEEQLKQSIKKILMLLPDETVLIPGHFSTTTIRDEKLHNSFIHKVIYGENSSCAIHDSF
jgi:glyoxylase-like metal-dependent hydrolase (beta-lactamase superfamily II)